MRWALPLVLLLLAGCVSKDAGQTLEPAATTTTLPTPSAPASSPSPSPAPSSSTPPTPTSPPTPPTPSPPPKPAPEVFERSGNTSTASVAGQSPDGAVSLPFTVKPNATKLTALLWWNGTGTDYDLKVYDPHACPAGPSADQAQCVADAKAVDKGTHADDDGSPAQPDSPAKVELSKDQVACASADGCKWTAEAFAKTAAQAGYHLLVVVEYA